MATSNSLRPYLEYQADRVEATLAAHHAPGRIVGGTAGPRLIRFVLDLAPHVRFSAIRNLSEDLALALRVTNLSIEHGQEGVVLQFSNPNTRAVKLIDLLDEVLPVPIATALLGLTDTGMPLLARLASADVAHALVSGTTGSGKSVLLRTMAASLVLTQSPDTVRLVLIDPKGRTFEALRGAPHLARPPVASLSEAHEALRSAVRAMERRDARGERPGKPGVPHVVFFIDELADLVMQGGAEVSEALTRLVQRGREAGIHLVAATQRPSAAIMSNVMRANFPLRLVGRVVTAEDARAASGRAGTNAHLLNGRGDFLAISGGERTLRFQVAQIGEDELREHMALTGVTTPILALPVVEGVH